MTGLFILIIGIGNPDIKLSETRHNAGAMLAALLTNQYNYSYKTTWVDNIMVNQFLCTVCFCVDYVNITGNKIYNHIGKKFSENNTIVITFVDDLDIPVGQYKCTFGIGSHGHNGLRSIYPYIKDKGYLKVRIGIGRPEKKKDVKNYVLEKFSPQEKQKLQEVFKEIISKMPEIIQHAIQKQEEYKSL